MLEKLTILHTNDLHSHFEYWPRIQKYLIDTKHDSNHDVMVFDIGDHLDRFHPYTDATLGRGNVEMLNESGYNAVTIGNNEGITLANQDLMSLYSEATFDCLLANLYLENGTRPQWAKPYQVYKTTRNTKIGVIGVTINYTNFYSPLHWKVTDPFEELRTWLPRVKQESDILIVLSHLGLTDDERIAHEFPEVDIVLGAHTHHVLPEGKWINQTLLCCTGKYGQHIGKVDVLYDPDNRSLVKTIATLLPTEHLDVIPDEDIYVKNLETQGRDLLSTPVANITKNLESNWFHENEFIQMLCEGLTEWCDADCSFLNAGIIVEDLEAGIVTDYDIHRICPHPINPCTLKLSGAELREVLLQTKDDQYTSLELKGFGFRGKVFGKMVYDRIEFSGEGSAMSIQVNGEEIEPDQIYQVATIDMFAFARFYPILTRSEKKFFLPEFIRDILRWKLASEFPLTN